MRTFLVSRCAMNPSDSACSSCSSRFMSAFSTAMTVLGVCAVALPMRSG